MHRKWSHGLFVAEVLLAGVLVLPAMARAASLPEAAFVDEAVGAYMAGKLEAAGADFAAIDSLAAAALLDFRLHPRELGRLWVQEVVLGAGGSGFRRQAAEEAAGGGETPRRALARLVTEAARSDGRALLRAAARLYATRGTEASPSRLRLFDLEAGALDAAPPAPMSVRHRSYVPEGETDAIRLAWPSDGGDGAAVVRYDDAGLPPDVVFFAAGDGRTIPLSGVARIDFVVAGSDLGRAGLVAPVECTREASPFRRLEARAEATTSGPRLTWSTVSHEGLRGWAIFREEVAPDGRIGRAGPELVPSSEASSESFGYAFVDTGAAAETFYRYTVWAVTEEGLLTRAFTATLETGRIDIAKLRRD
jgi:hypothetical protein